MGKKTNQLILLSALFQTFRMFTGATSTVYLINKGILENEIAALRMLQFIIVIAVDVSFGYIADKYSRKLSVLLGIFCSVCWLFITALSTYKPLLYVGEAFNALSLAFESGAFISLLINTYKKENGEKVDSTSIIAKHKQIFTLSMAVGALVNIFFPLDKLDYLWILAALLCLAVLVWGYFVIESDRKKVVHNYEEEIEKDLRKIFKKDLKMIHKILVSRKLLFICLIAILTLAFFKIIINYTQIVTYVNLPSLNNSYTHSIIFTFVLLAQSLSGYVMHNLNLSIPFLALCMTGLFTTLLVSSLPYLNIALWIALFFFLMSLEISISGKIHNNTTDEIRATVDSVINALSMVCASFFSWIIYLNYESINFIYVFSVYIFVAVCILNTFHFIINERSKTA